jgi:cyclase
MKISLIILFALAHSFSPGASLGQIEYSNSHVDVIRLQKDLYLLKENFQFTANSLVISGKKGLLIMDTGFREIAEDFADAVGFLKKKVEVIVNSHAHHDHVGANHQFKDAVVVGHADCKERFAQHGQDVKGVNTEYSFEFEDYEIECISFPGGHSSCDILIHVPDLQVAYLGDFYLSESFPLVITGDGSSVQRLISILEEVYQKLPEHTSLYPGHGKKTSMDELKSYMEMIKSTASLVKKEMDQGKSLREIQAEDLLDPWEGWGKFFPFITKNSWIEQIYNSYASSE